MSIMLAIWLHRAVTSIHPAFSEVEVTDQVMVNDRLRALAQIAAVEAAHRGGPTGQPVAVKWTMLIS